MGLRMINGKNSKMKKRKKEIVFKGSFNQFDVQYDNFFPMYGFVTLKLKMLGEEIEKIRQQSIQEFKNDENPTWGKERLINYKHSYRITVKKIRK